MLPVLFSIGPISISSFGFFLALGFLYGVFLIWRLTRAFELNEEKMLDLALLSFFGGLIGARILFIILEFDSFGPDPLKWVLITKYPGLNFWGALLGGVISTYFFVKRLNLNFWQVSDIASIGFLGGLILGNIGCFLGGCSFGIPDQSIVAVQIVGVIGKRFPVQAAEAVIFAIILWRFWPKAIHFHFNGKIASLSLIFFGIVRFFLEFFREKQYSFIGFLIYLLLFGIGIFIFYKQGKRSFRKDIKNAVFTLVELFKNPEVRNDILKKIDKSWYNQKVAINWKFNGIRKVLRRANVKPTPKNF